MSLLNNTWGENIRSLGEVVEALREETDEDSLSLSVRFLSSVLGSSSNVLHVVNGYISSSLSEWSSSSILFVFRGGDPDG